MGNIKSVVERYGIELKKKGSVHVGLCPFHSEKTPSFTVYEKTNTYKCWGCGVQGDDISFVMEIENCTFKEAKKKLGKQDFDTSKKVKQIQKEIFKYPKGVFEKLQTLKLVDNFTVNLLKKYPDILPILEKYKVVCASAGNYKNFTGFPHIDFQGELRGVKCFLYEKNLKTKKYDFEKDGKKIKGKYITWLHSLKKYDIPETHEFKDCYFGEHLIFTEKYDFVGIVESEKTAIICSHNFGGIWLATGSKTNIKQLLYKGLRDKRVFLFPDEDGFLEWENLLKEANNEGWRVSEVCKTLKNKEDLADPILRDDFDFIQKVKAEIAYFLGLEIAEPKIEVKKSDTNEATEDEKIYYQRILSHFDKDTILFFLMDKNLTGEMKEKPLKNSSRTIKFIIENGIERDVYSYFLSQNKLDLFYEFCEKYNIPLYAHAINDRLTADITPNDLQELFKNFSKTFFCGLKFDLTNRNFYNESCEVEIDKLLTNRLSNFMIGKNPLASSKNKTQFINDEVLKFTQALETLQDFNNIDTSYGDIEAILENGKKYVEARNIRSGLNELDEVLNIKERELSYVNLFWELWEFEIPDLRSFFFFGACNIRIKFFNDAGFYRFMLLHGDSGVGKDYILPAFLLGQKRDESEYFLNGDLKTKNNFLMYSINDIKRAFLHIVSDDINVLNKYANLDEITNNILRFDVKNKQAVEVVKRFNTMSTSNKKRVFFVKDTDQNAFARRFIVSKIKAKSTISEYKKLYNEFKNNENTVGLLNGFFYYLWKLAEKPDLMKMLDDVCFEHNFKNMKSVIYLNEKDCEIGDVLSSDAEKDLMFFDDSLYWCEDGKFYIRNLRKYASNLAVGRKITSEMIRKYIELNFENVEWSKKITRNTNTFNVSAIIPKKEFEEKKQDETKIEKIDLTEILKKYL